MPNSIVVDYSPYFAKENSLPPKHGWYTFLVGGEEFKTVGRIKDAVNVAKAHARAIGGVYTITLVDYAVAK